MGELDPPITAEGIARVERHLRSLDAADDPPNARMLARLRSGEREPQDVAFYYHELHEAELMAAGMTPREAHLTTLAWQGIDYAAGYERFLYHPSVIAALREHFNPAAWP